MSATDSRSYSNARKHANTTPAAANGHDNGNGPGNGNGNGSYPAGGYADPQYADPQYADPGYAYQAAPPAAVPPPAPAVDWYSAPPAEAQAPAYGNPYAHNGSGNGGITPAAYPDSQATAGYASYLADPLRVYSPPGYEAAAPYAEPGPAAYQQPLPAAGTVPYADGYQQHPYPEQAIRTGPAPTVTPPDTTGAMEPTRMRRADTGHTRPRVDKRVSPSRTIWRPRGPLYTAEEIVDRAPDHARTYHLHRLATALDTRGLHATVKTTYPAALHIFTPGATMLAESIGCTPGTDDRGHLRRTTAGPGGKCCTTPTTPRRPPRRSPRFSRPAEAGSGHGRLPGVRQPGQP